VSRGRPDTPADRARRRRSLAIALGLIAFMAIIYATTITRMHQNTRAGLEAARAAAAANPSGVR
jgi:hypothetical protein